MYYVSAVVIGSKDKILFIHSTPTLAISPYSYWQSHLDRTVGFAEILLISINSQNIFSCIFVYFLLTAHADLSFFTFLLKTLIWQMIGSIISYFFFFFNVSPNSLFHMQVSIHYFFNACMVFDVNVPPNPLFFVLFITTCLVSKLCFYFTFQRGFPPTQSVPFTKNVWNCQ